MSMELFQKPFGKGTFDQIHINRAPNYSELLIFFNHERIFFLIFINFTATAIQTVAFYKFINSK